MDLLSKAQEYRRRAAYLRNIARAVYSVRAHDGLIKAAVTWEQLAATAMREASWHKRIRKTAEPEAERPVTAPLEELADPPAASDAPRLRRSA